MRAQNVHKHPPAPLLPPFFRRKKGGRYNHPPPPPQLASLDGTAVGSGVALLAAGGQVEEHRREHGGGGQNQRLGEGPVGSVEREREGVDEAHHRPEALGQLEYGEGGDAVGRREERPDHRVDLPGDQWLSA